MTPTKEDMARDLAADLIRIKTPNRREMREEGGRPCLYSVAAIEPDEVYAVAESAIRRALAAEALLRRFLAATGSFGSRELASVTEDARELLGEVSP